MKICNIALLIGNGSRVPAILKCVGELPNAKAVCVLSCVGAGVGTKAALEHRIYCRILRLRDFGRKAKDREALAGAVAEELKRHNVDLVVMAGWMIIMPESFVREFRGRAINIHPSILPAYPGKGNVVTPKQWEDKAVPAGCTLHYIDSGMDTGRVIEHGYVVKKVEDYEKFSSFEEFEQAIHAKEDEVLCGGIKKLVAEI